MYKYRYIFISTARPTLRARARARARLSFHLVATGGDCVTASFHASLAPGIFVCSLTEKAPYTGTAILVLQQKMRISQAKDTRCKFL